MRIVKLLRKYRTLVSLLCNQKGLSIIELVIYVGVAVPILYTIGHLYFSQLSTLEKQNSESFAITSGVQIEQQIERDLLERVRKEIQIDTNGLSFQKNEGTVLYRNTGKGIERVTNDSTSIIKANSTFSSAIKNENGADYLELIIRIQDKKSSIETHSKLNLER